MKRRLKAPISDRLQEGRAGQEKKRDAGHAQDSIHTSFSGFLIWSSHDCVFRISGHAELWNVQAFFFYLRSNAHTLNSVYD
jgi:hypothetical protein